MTQDDFERDYDLLIETLDRLWYIRGKTLLKYRRAIDYILKFLAFEIEQVDERSGNESST